MDERKVQGYLSLSMRAGMAVFGEDSCLKSVRSAKCACLLLDQTASSNTIDRYRSACRHAGVPMYILPEDMIFRATGKPGVSMAIMPGGLANQVIGLLSDGDKDKHDIIGGASSTWRTSN